MDGEDSTRIDRRRFLVAAGAGTVAAAAGSPTLVGASATRRRRRPPPLGFGGEPTPLDRMAEIAREVGAGAPVTLVDLAAVDRNAHVVGEFAARNGWHVRPALKTFQCDRLSAYVVQRLPEPRGMVFDLAQVDSLVARCPAGTDLMMGWAPTVGEMRAYLSRRPPRGQRRHRLRILVDSPEHARHLARLAARSRRALPLDIALDLDSGMGRGGIKSRQEMREVCDVLRGGRDRLRLGAVVCYDGHATLTGVELVRRTIAHQARGVFRGHLESLAAEGGDLYDPATLVRNGPGSSNYRQWAGGGECNEVSVGSAYAFPGYLDDFDSEGLTSAILHAAPVSRITSDHPSVPLVGTTLPGAREEEILVKGGSWPDGAGNPSQIVWPPGARVDELSGGGNALVVPKGSTPLGGHVLFRPNQAGDGIERFGHVHAVREGTVRRVWPTISRPG